MKIDRGESLFGDMGSIHTNARVNERIEGCCSSLSPFLHVKNLKLIMNVMKLSIGTTLPQSSRYSFHNSTSPSKLLDSMFSLEKLAIPFKERYVYFRYFDSTYAWQIIILKV